MTVFFSVWGAIRVLLPRMENSKMRKLTSLAVAVVLVSVSATAVMAQEGETFMTKTPVYNMVMVQVHPNMGENYINNLRETWLIGTEEAMAEGVVEDYQIFTSLTPNDDGVNIVILTKHPNLASLDATDAWREQAARINERVRQRISDERTDEITSTVYPNIRTIVGAKLMREIEFINN